MSEQQAGNGTKANPAASGEEPLRTDEQIMADRRGKLAALEAAGTPAYPFHADPTASIAEVREAHDSLEDGAETDARYVLAGRMMGKRGQGKATFSDLQDRSGRMQ